ncbi:hypothetical protein ACFDR9_003826 [Janthinobacterium sp. CG_23.3]
MPAIALTLSVKSFQTPETSFTWAWPPSLPSVPTSRATRVTSPAKLFNWSTMMLMVLLSSSTSPLTSAVILRDRSPRATAVVTSAMLRTWPVRLLAIALTLSVRSFQTPATSLTWAWPPSLPSVPTSRATRVTSPAKLFNWSTMMLMVSFSCRISPRTPTVILRDRSPRATAVVTSAMLRTWPVRLLAIRLTLSVRSFHTPATPLTSAWPPSLPSVPTSRATRVTSPAKLFNWSTMMLMVSFRRRISPLTSTVILRDRSPCATAVVTSAMLRTWPVRLLAIRLTLSVRSFQTPETPLTSAWPPSLPSVPTSRATRVTSPAKLFNWSTIRLMVSFRRRISPLTSTVILRDRSPWATAVVTSAMLRTWPVRLLAIRLTLSVKSFQTPEAPWTIAWPPSLPSVPTSRATRVTSLEKLLSCSSMVLMMWAFFRNSPFSGRPSMSSCMLSLSAPRATAPMTRPTSRTGCTRLSIIELIALSSAPQAPAVRSNCMRWPSRPSLPTSSETCPTALASCSWVLAMSLTASAILPSTPPQSCPRRALKSPSRSAVRACNSNGPNARPPPPPPAPRSCARRCAGAARRSAGAACGFMPPPPSAAAPA